MKTTALLLCGIVLGCGGRTSVMDVGNDSGGTGSEGVGTQAGQRSASACQTYCKGLRNICPVVSEKSCNTNCNTELEGSGDRCRELKELAFFCLDNELFYQISRGCDETLSTVATSCGEELNAFRACNLSPAPRPALHTCDRYSVREPQFCGERWNCSGGEYYDITCVNVAGSSKCACLHHTNPTQRLEPGSWTSEACERSAGLCGFPGIP